MNGANFKLNKWQKELKSLMGDVVYLYQNNKEFLSLVDKWNNKSLDYEIWNFAKRNYVSYMSMAIRRLCDDHKDAISLWKLINDIQINASAVKRSWFLSEWPDGEGESLFIEFFDKEKVLKDSIVANHISNLENTTKSIRDRADKFEAHKDRNQKLPSEPVFNDIDKSVDVICELYKKYYYLLTQNSLSF